MIKVNTNFIIVINLKNIRNKNIIRISHDNNEE